MVKGERVSDAVFVSTVRAAALNGGTKQGVANALNMSYGNLLQRIKRINAACQSVNKPGLPELMRKTGPRKNASALADLVNATETVETVETPIVAEASTDVETEVVETANG